MIAVADSAVNSKRSAHMNELKALSDAEVQARWEYHTQEIGTLIEAKTADQRQSLGAVALRRRWRDEGGTEMRTPGGQPGERGGRNEPGRDVG